MTLDLIWFFYWNTGRIEYMPIQFRLTTRPLVAEVSGVTSNFKCYRLPLQSFYCNEISTIWKRIKNSIRVGFFCFIFSHGSSLFGPRNVKKFGVGDNIITYHQLWPENRSSDIDFMSRIAKSTTSCTVSFFSSPSDPLPTSSTGLSWRYCSGSQKKGLTSPLVVFTGSAGDAVATGAGLFAVTVEASTDFDFEKHSGDCTISTSSFSKKSTAT